MNGPAPPRVPGSVGPVKTLKRILIGMVVLNVIAVLAAQIAKRKIPVYGDAESDVFSLLAAMDGVQFASRSTSLRAATATAIMGGLELDLTEAELATAARLDATAVMGGIDVLVPAGWRVELMSGGFAGGAENLTDPDGVDFGAPELIVDARTYFGGVSIRAAEEAGVH